MKSGADSAGPLILSAGFPVLHLQAALMTAAGCTLNPDYTSETHENDIPKTLKEKSPLSGCFSLKRKLILLSGVPEDGKLSEKSESLRSNRQEHVGVGGSTPPQSCGPRGHVLVFRRGNPPPNQTPEWRRGPGFRGGAPEPCLSVKPFIILDINTDV